MKKTKKAKSPRSPGVITMYEMAEEFGWDAPPLPQAGTITTGLPTLDKATGRLRGLVILGGEPGIGKSALLAQTVCSALESGAYVVWVEVERARSAPYEDLRAHVLGVSREAAAGPLPQRKAEFRRWDAKRGKGCFVVDRAATPLNLDSLLRTVRRVSSKARTRPVLLAIDSLQQLANEVLPDLPEKAAIDRVVRELTKLPPSVCAVCVSQVTKESLRFQTGSERAFLGSASILHLAEVALFMRGETSRPGRTIEVVKSRYSQSGQRCPATFDASQFRIVERRAGRGGTK